MSVIHWTRDPQTIKKDHYNRHRLGPPGLLFLWATWAVEGLYYLANLDDERNNYPKPVGPYQLEVVDVTHVRWATGTAITALDLCAAALGQQYCNQPKRDSDLRDFDPAARRKNVSRHRSNLPPLALQWIDNVLTDSRYKNIHEFRNPLTHSWLSLLRQPMGRGHTGRMGFKIISTNTHLGARELVTQSRDFAFEHVDAFLQVIDIL